MTALNYSAGTVSLTNGSAVVTGIDTAWQTALIKGGEIFVQAAGNPLPIATVDSDTQITSALSWTGATGTYEYVLRIGTAYDEQIAKNAEILARLLSEIEAGTIWKYDASGDTAGRDFYDTRPKGFSYLDMSGEQPALWVKASNTEGDWAGPFAYGVGPQGEQGDTGPYTELIAGPTTTLPAGTPAEVTAVQIDEDTVRLDFAIPKGLDGDIAGPDGAPDNAVALFDGPSGKTLKSGGLLGTAAFKAVSEIAGFRNLIINPLLGINQREKSGTVILAAGQYGHDRFKAGASGCTYTFSTSNGVTTFNISAGSLRQVIEASSFAGRGGQYFLSWAGTAQGRIDSGSYGASGAVSATCDGSANVSVEWGTGTLSLPQFERGFVTDFSARHRHQELALCEFYCRQNYVAAAGYASVASQIFHASVSFTMRGAPTISVKSIIQSANVASATFADISASGFRYLNTSIGGAGVNSVAAIIAMAEAEL